MEVIDPGHTYILNCLDAEEDKIKPLGILIFVKREGEGYPGNVGHRPGTTTQEVLRALIDRTKYVDNQIHDDRNDQVLYHLRSAIFQLEMRAAERHGRVLPLFDMQNIENEPYCEKCGHIGCQGDCH
jgi:hypothetical protein